MPATRWPRFAGAFSRMRPFLRIPPTTRSSLSRPAICPAARRCAAYSTTRRGAVAIGCYPDSARDLAAVIRETCAAHRVAISRDAVDFLVGHLGGDRLLTRAELEKLTLYAGDGGRIEFDDARAVIADSAALSLDDALLAAVEGDAPALDRALARVFQEGESPVTVIRALLRHLQRLHLLASRIAAGVSIEEAMRAARPPIFFKEQDSYRRQLRRWSEERLRDALDRAAEAEFRMKLTGSARRHDLPRGAVRDRRDAGPEGLGRRPLGSPAHRCCGGAGQATAGRRAPARRRSR